MPVWNLQVSIGCYKNLDKLEPWLEEAEKLQIDEINSYIAGLRKDLDAVENSITYSYSNGLAEGSANNLKVIKELCMVGIVLNF